MPKYSSILSGVIIFAYPLAVYWGVSSFGIGSSAIVIAGLFLFRFFCPPITKTVVKYAKAVRFLAAVGVILASLSWLMQDSRWFLYYPVAVNLIFLALFSYSLIQPPSMIERFARLKEPDLPESGVKYTRMITKIWCLFFFLNGLAALYTSVVSSLEVWTLYNGFISYLLIGFLVSGEYFYRVYYLKRF